VSAEHLILNFFNHQTEKIVRGNN